MLVRQAHKPMRAPEIACNGISGPNAVCLYSNRQKPAQRLSRGGDRELAALASRTAAEGNRVNACPFLTD